MISESERFTPEALSAIIVKSTNSKVNQSMLELSTSSDAESSIVGQASLVSTATSTFGGLAT